VKIRHPDPDAGPDARGQGAGIDPVYFGVLFIIKTHGPLPLAGDRSGALVPRLTEGVLSVW
jgi:hypothetical protein